MERTAAHRQRLLQVERLSQVAFGCPKPIAHARRGDIRNRQEEQDDQGRRYGGVVVRVAVALQGASDVPFIASLL